MDEGDLRARLDACIFDGDFKNPSEVQALKDPFPKWFEKTGI
jgi:hypothetical protein